MGVGAGGKAGRGGLRGGRDGIGGGGTGWGGMEEDRIFGFPAASDPIKKVGEVRFALAGGGGVGWFW